MSEPEQQAPSARQRLFVMNDPHGMRVNKALAIEIGLNESIVLLQIEFLISISDNYRDGRWWTYQSTRGLQREQFPWWSTMTIERALRSLVSSGYLVSTNIYNRHKYDKTRWFALGDKLAELNSIASVNTRKSPDC